MLHEIMMLTCLIPSLFSVHNMITSHLLVSEYVAELPMVARQPFIISNAPARH